MPFVKRKHKNDEGVDTAQVVPSSRITCPIKSMTLQQRTAGVLCPPVIYMRWGVGHTGQSGEVVKPELYNGR